MADGNEDAMDIDPPSQNQVQPENATDSEPKPERGQPLQRANEPPPQPPPESTTPHSDVSRQASSSHEPSTSTSSSLVTSSRSTSGCESRESPSGRETRGPVGNREMRGQVGDREARGPAAGRESRGSASSRESRGPLSLKELMGEREKLLRDSHCAAKTIDEQERGIKFLRAKLAILQSDNEFLKSETVGFQSDLKTLKADLIQSNDKNRVLKNAIANMHASNSSMITDVQISKDYQYLISQIKNWTFSHFCEARLKLAEKTIANFDIESDANGVTATVARKYLKEGSKRRFLVIGMLVMRYLHKHIFHKFLFGLADNEEKYLSGLGRRFKKTATPKGVRFWCSTTAQMISATERHRHEVQERKKELVVQLESVLVDTIPQGGDTEDRVNDLKIIVDQAADLALALSVQRAEYFLYSPPPGGPFPPYVESAEDDAEGGGPGKGKHEKENSPNHPKSPEKIIELTVYPGLFKAGNENGEKFDETVSVCNAKVLQKAPEKNMISRGLSAVGLSS